MTGGKPHQPWGLFVHPAFAETFDALVAQVARLKRLDPEGFRRHPKTKLLKRLTDLIEVEIPGDPGAPEYALGNTLGPEHRHWRRASFWGRFRLFFRYSSKARVIVYAWVNDETTLRKAGGRSDPYAVFDALLRKGAPPDGWDDLVSEAAAMRLRTDEEEP